MWLVFGWFDCCLALVMWLRLGALHCFVIEFALMLFMVVALGFSDCG